MIISIKNGQPYFMFDQLMLVREIRELHRQYEDGSIHYAILFGWDGSPFKAIDDPKSRHESVMAEIKHGGWVLECPKLEAAKKLWERDAVIAAIEVINKMAKLRHISKAAFYQNELSKVKEMLNTISDYGKNQKKSSVGPDGVKTVVSNETESKDLKDIANTRTVLLKQIKDLEKDYEDEMASVKKKMESNVDCALNYFIEV
jgi:hypothetical protein